MLSLCESYVRDAFGIDTIQYLAASISAISGSQFDASRVRCVERLPQHMQAGYVWSENSGYRRGEIILDASKIVDGQHVERCVKHEMIHAFDDVRGHIDPSDCYHHACSEIRAARLSGDCSTVSEMKSGHVDIFASGIRCVERRATFAVESNPICKGFSSRAVEKLMPACYSDTSPFAAPIPFSGNFSEKL